MLTKRSFATLLLAFATSLCFSQAEKNVLGNKTLPSVQITDLIGNKIDISTFGSNGKITVFSFWATWCSPCKKELNNINDLYETWVEDYDMEVVAISIDDIRAKAKVKTYSAGQGWEFDVLLDVNQDLKRALNFQTIPYTILVDQEGNIVYTHNGYVEGDEYDLEEKISALAK